MLYIQVLDQYISSFALIQHHVSSDKIEIQFKVLDIFADYGYKYQEAHGMWSPNPVIILNGLKSLETEFKWTKLDGSLLNYTGQIFQSDKDDVDYGFTTFSENQIHGNVVKSNIARLNSGI